MSQNDTEDDIWEYKPLKKKKKQETPPGPVRAYKRISKGETQQVKRTQIECDINPIKRTEANSTANEPRHEYIHNEEVLRTLSSQNVDCPQLTQDGTLSEESLVQTASSGGFCPVCQMPFSILVVQSHRWHVAECLDTPGDDSKECPDGLRCSSTIPTHFKRYSHSLLAHSRATDDTVLFRLSQETTTNEAPNVSFPADSATNDGACLVLESSQESAMNLSTLSSQNASPIYRHSGTTTPSKSNAFLLLRSPGPEDIRKKKGWSPSVKGLSSTSSSQEGNTGFSTPLKEYCVGQALEDSFIKAESSASSGEEISYSPLSQSPVQSRKTLFPASASEDEISDSGILFSDALSCDNEFFADLAQSEEERVDAPAFRDTQVLSIIPLAPRNQLASSTAVDDKPHKLNSSFRATREELTEACLNATSARPQLQSPQSVVLEQLRKCLSSPNNKSICHSNSFDECSTPVKTKVTSTVSQQVPSSSQTSTTSPSLANMAPRKGQGKAAASGLKQTDIGVFFGLKPLKDKEKEKEAGSVKPGVNPQQAPVSRENSRGRGESQRGQWRGRRTNAAEASNNAGGTSGDGSTQSTHGEGRGRGGRSRWNRGRADGEPKHCPFYKKIPGTKFSVDAFSYGVVEGITAYFLTHFHSDHYGGLKKSSTVPIYCNRITGNLVKSKLKVEEQYVHILPMNTEVTVEGVRVLLLEANHCPGSAMLLFFLPDGQIVLHTGDFRADPCMEKYPELLSCRVQTLYLDTTYCSPEYTFPTQQEVITFAANTAFECVTLDPRTLVVCGSYSVGKEKVFLALAEVLGSKVGLSRDKFNTMCCLESEQIRQLITTDLKAAQVHVLSMMQLNFKNLQAHLRRFSSQYDQLLAFKPTGWTFSRSVEAVENIRPQVRDNISIYDIPYSEHSSFLEMKRFVQWLRPLKIIPTVNVGSLGNRKAMEKCFSEWMTEANKANTKRTHNVSLQC